MVATIHTVCQNDTENRSKQDDNRQRDHRRVQRRTGNKNKRHFYLGSGRRSSNRTDMNGERQRPKQNEYKPAIFIISTPLYSRKE